MAGTVCAIPPETKPAAPVVAPTPREDDSDCVLSICVCVSVLQAAGPPRCPGAAGAEGLPALASPPGRGAELPGGYAGVEVKHYVIPLPSCPPHHAPPFLQGTSRPSLKSAVFPF